MASLRLVEIKCLTPARAAQRLGIVLLFLRVLNMMIMWFGVDTYCLEAIKACRSNEASQCKAYPCVWDQSTELCIGSVDIPTCISSGDIYNAEHTFFPQMIGQLLYCWLLAAYAANKERAGALLVGDNGAVPAPVPP